MLGGTVFGSASVGLGLALAYLALGTPMVSRVGPPISAASSAGIIVGIWAFSVIAGGAFVVSGTDRLAAVLASVRYGPRPVTPVLRAAHALPAGVVVAVGVVPDHGRPIPELVVGRFGAAVIHECPEAAALARSARSGLPTDIWRRTDDPAELVALDAERVRRWLHRGELDFVVRVYAALVTADTTIERTPACAVIEEPQIAAWLASLPAQRTLSAGATLANRGDGSRCRRHRRPPGGEPDSGAHAEQVVGEPGLEPGTSGI